MLSEQAAKKLAKMFGKYTSTWAGDERAIVTEAERMEVTKQVRNLKDALRDLQNAKKRDAAKVAEAQRILAISREKLVAAAKPEVLGRYSRRESEVAESRAESSVVKDAKADVNARQETLLGNIARDTQELQMLRKSAEELGDRGDDAFDRVAQAAQDAMGVCPTNPWMT